MSNFTKDSCLLQLFPCLETNCLWQCLKGINHVKEVVIIMVCPLLPVVWVIETSTMKQVFLWYRFQRDTYISFEVLNDVKINRTLFFFFFFIKSSSLLLGFSIYQQKWVNSQELYVVDQLLTGSSSQLYVATLALPTLCYGGAESTLREETWNCFSWLSHTSPLKIAPVMATCQMPGVTGSALRLVGLMSVCGWVSMLDQRPSVWQHSKLSSGSVPEIDNMLLGRWAAKTTNKQYCLSISKYLQLFDFHFDKIPLQNRDLLELIDMLYFIQLDQTFQICEKMRQAISAFSCN